MLNRKKEFLAGGAAVVAACLIGGYAAVSSAAAGPVNPPASSDAPSGTPGSFADIVQKVAPAVVSIDVEGKLGPSPVDLPQSQQGPTPFGDDEGGDDDDQQDSPLGADPRHPAPKQDAEPMKATGSGFFISANGYIVTNNHVVEGASKITVRMTDERSLTAKLIGRDPATDLAVVKVEGTGFPFVDFEERARPRVGDWVIAVGNPFNLGGTATAGIVSALGRSGVSGSSFVDYMQIDAPINRGNSGGPTFDVYGRVVGVNAAIFSPTGGSVGIGFDIPVDVVMAVSKQLISDGKVTRGYIGAAIQGVTPDIASSLGLSSKAGALVADLTQGGPAEKAGLQTGDLIVSVEGHAITSAADVTRQVALARPGDAIHLQVRRGGQVRELTIRSGMRPSEAAVLASTDRNDPAQEAAPSGADVLGMRLARNDHGGVTVQGVIGASDAGRKGLRRGDEILQVGSAKVVSPADIKLAVDQAKQGGRPDVLLLVGRGGHQTFVPVKIAEAAKPSDNQG
jgi:serine protease Do